MVRWDSQSGLCNRGPSSAFQYDELEVWKNEQRWISQPHGSSVQDFLQIPGPPFVTSEAGGSCDPETLSNIASAAPDFFGPSPDLEQDIFHLLVSAVTDFDSPTRSAQAPFFASTFDEDPPATLNRTETPGDGSLCDNTPIQHDTGSDYAKLPLQPSGLHQCHDCYKQFSAERLRTHRKPRAPGQPPSCKVRYPCPAEQCGKDYADRPGLTRHVRQCRHLNADGGGAAHYQCRCGKSFGRWDKFLAHHNRGCGSVGEQRGHAGRYLCQCKESFHSISSFLEHHRSEYKKLGRPKNPPAT